MKAWTDYPILELGDISGKEAPIREIEILNFDGNKYCDIMVEGIKISIKLGYCYSEPGRSGKVPVVKYAL